MKYRGSNSNFKYRIQKRTFNHATSSGKSKLRLSIYENHFVVWIRHLLLKEVEWIQPFTTEKEEWIERICKKFKELKGEEYSLDSQENWIQELERLSTSFLLHYFCLQAGTLYFIMLFHVVSTLSLHYFKYNCEQNPLWCLQYNCTL